MRLTKISLIAVSYLFLYGCSTSQQSTLPQPDTDVKEVWETKMGTGSNDELLQQRSTLRRELSPALLAERQADYTRNSYREIFNQFPRLPNPDVVFYVYPHRNGSMPVPGYSTVFPLYERVHYATPSDAKARMPVGER
ncbi:lipoprotein [Shewanella sairae]|uniref:Lipoprotein n=1 Tax=Shewanella sairae TaxID=190310 RepID=A0ABQ4P5V2_9GAMM|nr:TIGR03751 family conjugal transfer lipoprotein [Shewanella sairae]MCL1130467.1 TIGR03751 family conjugal transfer lipoprotein [Shewanella sairae]GIU42839.1 lipoprotein [Shewanella sairae]